MEENCRRCTEYLGGFKFPWIGTWNSSAVLALPGSDPRLAWQSYYDRLGEAKLDLLLIEPLRTHWTARDFAPDNIFGLVAFIEHNAESMVDLTELWDVWKTWQSPRRGWRDPSMVPIPADLVAWRAPRARAVRSLWGWLGAMEAGEEPLPPCKACGLPTPELCERCFSSVCSTCPPNVQDVTPSCVETHLQQLRPSDVCLLPDDTEVWSAVSGPARTLQTLAAVVSGVAMAYHPGAYAVQAAGEAPPCAETAMERVAATRVEQWRAQWGLHDETDFAYAFASYDSAVAHGGHHVADAWLQARSKTAEADLIPQAAAVAESSGSRDRPATWPTPKASMMKKSKMVQALQVRPGPDQPEHVLLRAAALRKAFSQAKVMRPQGELTPERYAQWQDALDTLSKRKDGGERPEVLG